MILNQTPLNNKDTLQAAKPVLADKKLTSLTDKLFNRLFFIILFVGIIVLFLVGYFFFIRQFSSQLASLKDNQIPQRQQVLNNLEKQLIQSNLINTLYTQLNPILLEKANLMLPSSPNLPDLLVNLDALVASSGFSLQSINLKITDEKGQSLDELKNIIKNSAGDFAVANDNVSDTTTLPAVIESSDDAAISQQTKNIDINLQIKGSGYAGFRKLIYQLEHNLRLLDVLKFDFSPADDSFNITLRSYYL
ncbi:MAG TPA: hypothetical protein PLH37_02850 [bacterium]|nr:hypothetical protein [bacterium]